MPFKFRRMGQTRNQHEAVSKLSGFAWYLDLKIILNIMLIRPVGRMEMNVWLRIDSFI
jgi:hypothetical protein